MTPSIQELHSNWLNATKIVDVHKYKFLLSMRVAAGQGLLESQLERLLAWVSGALPKSEIHTRLENPIEILMSKEAWCDQHVHVFLWGVKELFDLPGRILTLSHTDGKNGHTVCEVMFENKWILFDPHPFHVATYRDNSGKLMGFADIQNDLSVIIKEQHWWRGENGIGKEGFFMDPAQIHDTWAERPLHIAR